MPDDPPPPTVVTEAEDVRTLLTIMTRTLTAVTEARTSGANIVTKLEECPQKRSSSSLDAWIKEVILWNDSNTGKDPGLSAKKYLKFLDSVYKSEGCSDLKNLVQVEFVENESFDKKGEEVIKKVVAKIQEKLGQTDLEKCSDAWLEFINIKQEPGESANTFVTRFEKVETQLTNVKIVVPNKALAIHLINRSSMEEQSKENVLTKTKLDNESEIYPSMKKSIREMKGKLTRNDTKTSEPKSSHENKTFYGRQEERDDERNSRDGYESKGSSETKPWRNGKDDSKYRKGRSNSKYRGKRYSSRSRNRNRDFSENRGFRRDHSRGEREYNRRDYRDDYKIRENKDSYRGRNDSRRRNDSRSRNDSRNRNEPRRNDSRGRNDSRRRSDNRYRGNDSRGGSSSNEVNVVHYSKYCRDTIYDSSEVIKEALKNCNDSERDFIEVIYSEGNCEVDPYKLIVDTACPKTVTGRPWMDAFIASKGDVKVSLEKEDEKFRFGPSQVYKSKENYTIEVNIGDLKESIKVSVVDADIPLLLGLDYQTKWGMMIDIGKKEIFIRRSRQLFQMDACSSHWTLPIQSDTLHKRGKYLVFSVNLLDMNNSQLRKHVKKVHKNLCHKTEEQLLKLFHMAGKDTTRVRNTVKSVVETCIICRRFK